MTDSLSDYKAIIEDLDNRIKELEGEVLEDPE